MFSSFPAYTTTETTWFDVHEDLMQISETERLKREGKIAKRI